MQDDYDDEDWENPIDSLDDYFDDYKDHSRGSDQLKIGLKYLDVKKMTAE